jgi:cytochrome c-type biogenesis protein CcsB
MSNYLLQSALVLYLLSALFYAFYITTYRRGLERAGNYLLLAAFLLHLITVIARYSQTGYTPITTFYESLSFFALCITGFFVFLTARYRVDMLGAFLVPVVCLMLIWALTFPAEVKPLPPILNSYWLPVHVVFAFLGNAVFFTGFLISLVYLMAERRIKKKKVLSLSPVYPSLETLDLVNYKCMSFGFPFLTIGIITGSIWAQFAWGSYWSWDPKEIWSLITWIVYALLIHNRLTIGWRGRKTAYLMILGFLSVTVTFLGVSFLLGGLHSYM